MTPAQFIARVKKNDIPPVVLFLGLNLKLIFTEFLRLTANLLPKTDPFRASDLNDCLHFFISDDIP